MSQTTVKKPAQGPRSRSENPLCSSKSSNNSFLGIQFAPLKIPLRRRLETLIVFYAVWEFLFGLLGFPVIGYIIFYTPFYYLGLLYLVWIYSDRETPRKGGRLLKWTRKLTIWKYFVNYYPMTLIKTIDLDPKKNYIFGYHPHGIMASGAFGSFATDATGFSKLFPKITTYLVTLGINFWFPFHRDLSLARGLVDSSKESINWLLQNCGKGNAVVIVIGGAAESLNAVPNTMKLTLRNRKGFIKLALQNGASIVPVISFGENELYNQSLQKDNSLLRKFQNTVKQILKFTFPIFHGRGIFQYSIGFLPYRQPVFTIVGIPILIEHKIENPTQEEIDKFHNKYLKGLEKLFNDNKAKYANDPNIKIEFV